MNEAVIVLLTLSYSLILGIIVAQVVLTAPVVFKVLDNDNASKFLRAIFPRYYLLLFLICLVASLISYLWFSVLDTWIALTASMLAFIGFIIIPIATTISSWFNCIFLFIYLKKDTLFSFNQLFFDRF